MKKIIEFSKPKNKKVLENNRFFSDLCSLMKNVEFAEFYKTHFNDWTDIECMIFYMKLYSTISYEYEKRFNEEIDDSTMTFMLHKIMSNGVSRKFAFDTFRLYKNEYGHSSSEGFRKLLTFD